MSGEKLLPQEMKDITTTENPSLEKSDLTLADQQELVSKPESGADKRDENKEMKESVDKVLDWIKQGAEIQRSILDLTKRSFEDDLSGDEAANIIQQFESIPGDIAKVVAQFDTAIVALMEQKRDANSDLSWALRNAARLRGELEERMSGIEQSMGKDGSERSTTIIEDSFTKSGEEFINWSKGSLKEIKGKSDELDKMQKEEQEQDLEKIEELQQEIDEWKESVSQTFRRFIADSNLHFLRFRTNDYRLLNLRLASPMEGEIKALEVLKFKRQDEQLMRFADEFIERMTKYQNELKERLEELSDQK